MMRQESIEQYQTNKTSVISVKKPISAFPEKLIFVGAIVAIFIMLLFIYYIFSESLPVFSREGIGFITGTVWDYGTDQYGILDLIAGTMAITVTTIVIACPLSILTAIYLAEFAHPKIENCIRPMIELLVGIPSVVYGILGSTILAGIYKDSLIPFLSSILGFIPIFAGVKYPSGQSILLASSILAVMILPTITVITVEAMRSVPREYHEASISLGATKWETIKKVIIPVSMPGIITAVMLGLMRAMGETMAIVMLTGNAMHMPHSIFDTTYAMTSKLLNDITFYYGIDGARSALMGIALVLFVIEMMILLLTKLIGTRGIKVR